MTIISSEAATELLCAANELKIDAETDSFDTVVVTTYDRTFTIVLYARNIAKRDYVAFEYDHEPTDFPGSDVLDNPDQEVAAAHHFTHFVDALKYLDAHTRARAKA